MSTPAPAPAPAPGPASPALPAARRSQRLAVAALLAGALGIAFAPIFVRVSELGPSATAFWRLAFALPALFLWAHFGDREVRSRRAASGLRDFARLSVPGLFFAGDLAVWHWSIHHTSVANSTLLANFAPIFVTLASWLLWGQRFSATFLAGLGLALAGAVVLMGRSLTLGADTLLGDGLGLVTAAFYAGYILSVGKLRAEFPTATLMAWSGVVTALALLPVALLSGEGLLAGTARGWAVLLGLALLSHAGGQSLIAYALAHLPAAFSSVSLLLQPAAAAVLAWALLDEALVPLQGLGGLVVLAGIYLARRGSR
jgi:drug/metabolite transporter (DMT)-like permease